MLRDVSVIARLVAEDPAQATTLWPVLEAVENGIVSGNELVGQPVGAAHERRRCGAPVQFGRPFGAFPASRSALPASSRYSPVWANR